MEMLMVKNEENIQGRCRSIIMEDGEGQSPAKYVKRRRRDLASAAALGCADSQSHQQQNDQTSAVAAATTVKRSSRFRGVSRHRWTGRYEAHLWDKLSWNVTQKKKGKQVYLGAYDEEEAAARAYDLAALKYWGTTTLTNFPILDYEKEIEFMQTVTKEEYLASLRRKSSGFSRGVSKYRGVARHHHNGRWEARIGRVLGNKYLYLGTYGTQEEAARAYDIAAIEYRGFNALTNFDLSNYVRWLKPEKNNVLDGGHDLQTAMDPHSVSLPSPTNYRSTEESKYSFFQSNPFAADFLHSPQKQEDCFQRRICRNSSIIGNKSSAPTALGLLLRSSLFKELVEKNLTVSKDETDGDEKKNQHAIGREDEFGGIICCHSRM